jgi:hypothetical protein
LDTYLEIAERVLRAARQPLTARAIFRAAQKAGIVPPQLYGKAQHKTLHARISVDILHQRQESRFFRTNPGTFFLSEFMSDESIPLKFRIPFSARRRTRDLYKAPVLTIDYDYFKSERFLHFKDWEALARDAEEHNALRYIDHKSAHLASVCVWLFPVVRRARYALAYRIGRYRDDRDSFVNKQTIGFPSLLTSDDLTLFSTGDYGATESSLNTILCDLDLSRRAFVQGETVASPVASQIVSVERENIPPVILIVMEWHCPSWFEPTTRRLSLNEPRWIDVTVRPNNPNDFDEWSVQVLDAITSTKNTPKWSKSQSAHSGARS